MLLNMRVDPFDLMDSNTDQIETKCLVPVLTTFNLPRSGVMKSCLVLPTLSGLLMIGVVLLSKRLGINPDNVATPVAASLGDLTTLALLAQVGKFVFMVVDGKSSYELSALNITSQSVTVGFLVRGAIYTPPRRATIEEKISIICINLSNIRIDHYPSMFLF